MSNGLADDTLFERSRMHCRLEQAGYLVPQEEDLISDES